MAHASVREGTALMSFLTSIPCLAQVASLLNTICEDTEIAEIRVQVDDQPSLLLVMLCALI